MPIVLGSSTTGYTLRDYRRTSADRLGLYFPFTAGSGSSTTQVVSTKWPIKSTYAGNAAYEGWFLMRPDAASTDDKTRFVKSHARNSGTITVDNNYANAVANGEAIELHGLIEPYTDMRSYINRVLALPDCRIVVEFTFQVADADDVRHSLASAASWLIDPDDVLQVGYLVSGEDRDEKNPFERVLRGKPVREAGTTYLTGFRRNTDDTVYVLATAPASALCRATGGTFGDLTELSATETDEALADPDWVAVGVEVLYLKHRLKHAAASDRKSVAEELARAVGNWDALCSLHYFGQVPPKTFRPLQSFSGSSTRWP